MAQSKMLIDASHPEETRVAVVRGNRIEEFDFESQAKKQLRGNIYLAKVTRVEPSLQAAFIDYGGNRHGFLAFSEIHPDYYQIPMADRLALLEEEAREVRENAEEEEGEGRSQRRRSRKRHSTAIDRSGEDLSDEGGEEMAADASDESDQRGSEDEEGFVVEVEDEDDEENGEERAPRRPRRGRRSVSAVVETDSISEPAPEEPAAEDGGEEDGAPDAAAEAEKPKRRATRRKPAARKTKAQKAAEEAAAGEAVEQAPETPVGAASDEAAAPAAQSAGEPADEAESDRADTDTPDRQERAAPRGDDEEEGVESVGQEDALEEVPHRRKLRRQYKIQEVIKRRQIMLVQVVKEERGNKGAALTTYLSLAGRYSVLMPNTARGGGISRKITNAVDRKRLKAIAQELEVPKGMGVILRTAGAMRTKAEIKRDFEYLMRLWENVRTLTLSSTAPCLVYEEGSLIKRSIRDLYDKDTGEILVQGEAGYREAKDFMRMLMPSHAKNVKPYVEEQSLFANFGVEQQLDRLLTPQVTLKSGGYIVINQTEALVSIDVNSGRSTREHSIEDTALQTNLEAADEVARQLRLRDLAGLIVIDFIDMEEKRNNRAVEKRLKEALKNDRARIQVGRISHFGLLEMSRQRIRVSVMESTMDVCPHCQGLGYVRSDSSIALHVYRAIEDYLTRNPRNDIAVRCPTSIAIDLLNTKRAGLMDLEARFGLRILIEADPSLPGQSFVIDKGEPATGTPRKAPVPGYAAVEEVDDIVDETPDDEAEEEFAPNGEGREARDRSERDEQGSRRKRRRRRGRRNGEENGGRPHEQMQEAEGDEPSFAEAEGKDAGDGAEEREEARGDGQKRKRRRGRRGGKRNRREGEEGAATDAVAADAAYDEGDDRDDGDEGDDGNGYEEAPVTEQQAPHQPDDAGEAEEEGEPAEAAPAQAALEPEPEAPSREPDAEPAGNAAEEAAAARSSRAVRRPRGAEAAPASQSSQTTGDATAPEQESAEDEGKPRRSGWWSRGRGFF